MTRRRSILVAALVLGFALVLAAVQSRWSPVHRLDVDVVDDLHHVELRHPGQVSWWRWVSDALSPDVLRIVAALAALGLWLRHFRRTAVLIVVAMAGAWVLQVVLKAIVGRDRPAFAHPVAHAPGAAFPSGHALTSIVAFGLLILLVPRFRVAAAAVGVIAVGLVGFSRLALGVHYVTDVLGGWLLGAAWLLLITGNAADTTLNRRTGAPAAGRRDADRPPGRSAC